MVGGFAFEEVRGAERPKAAPLVDSTLESSSFKVAETAKNGDVTRRQPRGLPGRNDQPSKETAMPLRQWAPAKQFEPEARAAPYDKVCVRDLILPARIGIWSEEQGISQRVRFTVELSVVRGGHRPGDLSSVVSYDFIIDGIKGILASGHVLLTETIAERVAEHCLADRRAVEVRVVVEKLDRIPGAALGCEIVRYRDREAPRRGG